MQRRVRSISYAGGFSMRMRVRSVARTGRAIGSQRQTGPGDGCTEGRREGFERSLASAQVSENQIAVGDGTPLRLQLGSQSAGAGCPLLAKVVAAWGNVPEEARRRICMMVMPFEAS